MTKIKSGKIPSVPTQIKPSKLPDQTLIRFSFKYLDTLHEKFKFAHRKGKYLKKLLERLRDVSGWCKGDFCGNHSKSLRAHPIDWKTTSERKGFLYLNKQLQDQTPYQFEISKESYGRVHGFFIDNTFFIVWLDPDHKLYS